MKAAPEKYRLTNHRILGSDASYGNNGFFVFAHPKIANYFIQCQISDGMGWEHVSVSLMKEVNIGRFKQPAKWVKETVERCPTWEEMCWVKNQFWNEDECVVQYHPPKSENVSLHNWCLHLWKPVKKELPMPESILVGPDSAKQSIPSSKQG